MARTTPARISTTVMKKKITSVVTRACGNSTMYAPRTAPIAPDAPRLGIVEFGSNASCNPEAASPPST